MEKIDFIYVDLGGAELLQELAVGTVQELHQTVAEGHDFLESHVIEVAPVSYTHLDVYKRQSHDGGRVKVVQDLGSQGAEYLALMAHAGVVSVGVGVAATGVGKMCIRDRFSVAF